MGCVAWDERLGPVSTYRAGGACVAPITTKNKVTSRISLVSIPWITHRLGIAHIIGLVKPSIAFPKGTQIHSFWSMVDIFSIGYIITLNKSPCAKFGTSRKSVAWRYCGHQTAIVIFKLYH
jgi:hypothetical protein